MTHLLAFTNALIPIRKEVNDPNYTQTICFECLQSLVFVDARHQCHDHLKHWAPISCFEIDSHTACRIVDVFPVPGGPYKSKCGSRFSPVSLSTTTERKRKKTLNLHFFNRILKWTNFTKIQRGYKLKVQIVEQKRRHQGGLGIYNLSGWKLLIMGI